MTRAMSVAGFKPPVKREYPRSYHPSKSLRVRRGKKERVTTKGT